MLTILPLFLGNAGTTEIVLVIVLIVILFGGKKIPELMRGMGRGVKEFKDAINKDYAAEDKAPEDTTDTDEKKHIEK